MHERREIDRAEQPNTQNFQTETMITQPKRLSLTVLVGLFALPFFTLVLTIALCHDEVRILIFDRMTENERGQRP